jgi:hypothetical protein
MSFLENLKEQSKSFFIRTSERIKDSEAYVQLQDRYQGLSPSGQKIARYGIVALLILFVVFIPYTKLSTSSENITSYETKRNLIRDLFKTYRDSSATQSVPLPPTTESLRFSIETVLQRAELMPEQKLGIENMAAEGRLIPQNLVANVFAVKLTKLNLKQIVDIGTSIAAISDSIKLKDIEIKSNVNDTRYYDVNYKVYTLNVPAPTPEPPPEPVQNNNRNRRNNNNTTDEKKETDE